MNKYIYPHTIFIVDNKNNIDLVQNKIKNLPFCNNVVVDNIKDLVEFLEYPKNKELIVFAGENFIKDGNFDIKNIELLEILKIAKEYVYSVNFIGLSKKQTLLQHNIFNIQEDTLIDLFEKDVWIKSHLITEKDTYIIGDIHEDVEALKSLMLEIPLNSDVVFCGDLVDKGSQTKEILLLLNEIEKKYNVIFVMGNHESFVYKRLTGEVDKIENENDNFSSVEFLEKDEESRQIFFTLINKMIPFLKIKNEGNFIVTHAPCLNIYLTKMTNTAKRNQRNLRFPDRGYDNMVSTLIPFVDEANDEHPIHLFGHVAHCNDNIKIKNKIWLDTGSVYGNKLTCVKIDKGGKIDLIQVNGTKINNKNDLFVFPKEFVTNKMKVFKK